MLDVETIEVILRKRRINTYSHISRLPYSNPVRIVLFGKPIYNSNVTRRRFCNVKSTMMKDINNYLDESTYCNLCDRKIRSTVYTRT